MKKITLLLGVAMMAIGLHAATVNWYVENIYEYGSSTTLANGYLVYFFDVNDCSLAAATSAIGSGDFSFLTKGYAASYQEDGEASIDGTGSYGNSANVEGYYIVFNAATTGDATYAYISSSDTITTGAAGQAGNFAFDAVATKSAGAWTATSAPEPTSGLLILLGMAGLTLRRRRA